jgi:hypothetical protein
MAPSKQYDDMVQNDLELMWTIQEYCQRKRWINNIMSRIISKHPFQDIGVVIWAFFGIGCMEIGTQHFFVVVLNLGESVSWSASISHSLCTSKMTRFDLAAHRCMLLAEPRL